MRAETSHDDCAARRDRGGVRSTAKSKPSSFPRRRESRQVSLGGIKLNLDKVDALGAAWILPLRASVFACGVFKPKIRGGLVCLFDVAQAESKD